MFEEGEYQWSHPPTPYSSYTPGLLSKGQTCKSKENFIWMLLAYGTRTSYPNSLMTD